MTEDARQVAIARLDDLIRLLRGTADRAASARFIEESEALQRAIAAFHLEGIRFRAFTLERQLARTADVPPDALPLFQEVKRHLEAAGFPVKSH